MFSVLTTIISNGWKNTCFMYMKLFTITKENPHLNSYKTIVRMDAFTLI